MTALRLYRVEIVSYPEGSDEEGWQPEGWEPPFSSPRFDGGFFWPSTSKVYKSRSGATGRANLLRDYGAEAIVVRSNPITWEATES